MGLLRWPLIVALVVLDVLAASVVLGYAYWLGVATLERLGWQ